MTALFQCFHLLPAIIQGFPKLQYPEKKLTDVRGHFHHPEIISKFADQAFYPIGSARCVMSHGHSVEMGHR